MRLSSKSFNNHPVADDDDDDVWLTNDDLAWWLWLDDDNEKDDDGDDDDVVDNDDSDDDDENNNYVDACKHDFLNTIFVSSHINPENPEGTRVIVGSMNLYRIYIRHCQESNSQPVPAPGESRYH